jgi:hypothetical protein
MLSTHRRNPSHRYAVEPIVCVAAYPLEQPNKKIQNAVAALIAGALLWVVFCLS